MPNSEYEGPAFLYAMRRTVDGAIKFGVSRNPQLRVLYLINTFKLCQIDPPEVVLVDWVFLKHPFDMEYAVHNYLDAKKAKFLGGGTTREWFLIDQPEIESIFRVFRKWPEALAS